jgi:hypothetical protein
MTGCKSRYHQNKPPQIRINCEHAAEAERLSQLVVEISNALVDLGMLPIQDITQFPKLIRKVLPPVGLILECLQEAMAFDIGPWD